MSVGIIDRFDCSRVIVLSQRQTKVTVLHHLHLHLLVDIVVVLHCLDVDCATGKRISP